MSNNDPNQPQQPGYGYPQQPGQPGGPQWGQPGPYGQQPPFGAPQPPKKHTGRNITFGCLGAIVLVIVIVVVVAVAATGGSNSNKASGTTATQAANSPSAGDGKAKGAAPAKSSAPQVVTFKVWGNAPAGALGAIDITYGSDNDTRQGHFKDGKFTATLPYSSKADLYNVDAQLQGSGDIHCSVTVKGKDDTAQAHGGYNICSAQLTNILGDWS